jgi:hypothetical protein
VRCAGRFVLGSHTRAEPSQRERARWTVKSAWAADELRGHERIKTRAVGNREIDGQAREGGGCANGREQINGTSPELNARWF